MSTSVSPLTGCASLYSDFLDCFSGNLCVPILICFLCPHMKVRIVVDNYGKYNLKTCSQKINPCLPVPVSTTCKLVKLSISQVFLGRNTVSHTRFFGAIDIFQSSLHFIFQWHHIKQGNRREGDGSFADGWTWQSYCVHTGTHTHKDPWDTHTQTPVVYSRWSFTAVLQVSSVGS